MSDDLTFAVTEHDSRIGADERAVLLENPGFGRVFTDHMVTIRWSVDKGWHDATVGPRKPFQMDPASAVLHYAQEIFEGMKAYRSGNSIAMFRPADNARRFGESAARLAMPVIPEALFLRAIEELVKVDRDWIPSGEDGSLYLRPFMFASEAFLGVRPASEYIFCVIACPVGPYFKGGEKPVKVWVSEHYTRAAPGGTGAAKCGGNYAASLVAQAEAIAHECDQVVFLDAAEHLWLEELGGMNVFVVLEGDRLVTPPLGTILPGITRASVLTLAREAGLTVEEVPYSFTQWREDAASGRLKEAFACGTAAVLASIGEIRFNGGSFTVGSGTGGPVTAKLKQQLVGIQRGTHPDTHGWLHPVD